MEDNSNKQPLKKSGPKIVNVEKNDDDDLTPTDTEVKFINEDFLKEQMIYRLCISPVENENSSGGSTPDAEILNESPFDVKVVPKLPTKSTKTPPKQLGQSCLQPLQSPQTPEKASRPLNFKNLSPRSVTYQFSAKYPSGVLRPLKVRRSYQSFFDLVPPEKPYDSRLRRERAKSEDYSYVIGDNNETADSLNKQFHHFQMNNPSSSVKSDKNNVTIKDDYSETARFINVDLGSAKPDKDVEII